MNLEKKANYVRPLGFGSNSLAYTDDKDVVKEIYGVTADEANERINTFKANYQAPKPNVKVLFPRVVNRNDRVYLVSPYVQGDVMPNTYSDDYFKDLVNYEEAKKNNREYIDRGHANFIQTADNEIVNFDPIPRLGENIREVVKQRIMTSPKSKLSKDQRVLKDILLANPKEYQNPHMWRLVQNEYKKRTPMTENEFKEIVSQTPPLIKIAKPRWAKGNIDEVLERVKVFLSNVADDAHGIAIKPDYDEWKVFQADKQNQTKANYDYMANLLVEKALNEPGNKVLEGQQFLRALSETPKNHEFIIINPGKEETIRRRVQRSIAKWEKENNALADEYLINEKRKTAEQLYNFSVTDLKKFK